MTNANSAPPLRVVLIAGISCSARLYEKLGSSEAIRAVDRCVKRIERSVDAWKGRIVQADSNEVLAAFDGADAAIQAAIDMQQRVADLPPVSGVKVAIRVGLSGDSTPAESSAAPRDLVKEAAMFAGLAKPTQILASEKFRQFVSPSLAAHLTNGGHLPESETTDSVLEVIASPSPARGESEHAERDPDEDIVSVGSASHSLSLRYRDDTILLNEAKRIVHAGRDAGSDIVLRDRRASRHHATIERRDDCVVLVDRSTNGSYVTVGGTPEVFVRRSEFILHAAGRIAFASSSTAPGADIVEFRLT